VISTKPFVISSAVIVSRATGVSPSYNITSSPTSVPAGRPTVTIGVVSLVFPLFIFKPLSFFTSTSEGATVEVVSTVGVVSTRLLLLLLLTTPVLIFSSMSALVSASASKSSSKIIFSSSIRYLSIASPASSSPPAAAASSSPKNNTSLPSTSRTVISSNLFSRSTIDSIP